MSLPMFPPADDPGPNFSDLLRRSGLSQPVGPGVWHPPDVGAPAAVRAQATVGAPAAAGPEIRHGTTVAALRYADGVVMAGDRRATEGYSIAHRAIEKVFPADRHSAVAFAGAAGPGIEMVKLFQTQLEHYEKVEGLALSLEGKANQLGQMIRGNLGMAMQGLAVLPLFAGYDLRRRTGRIFTYDLTGGRYEETDYHATGSGGRDARTTIKLGYREGMVRDEAIVLAIQALYEAADEDIATGGPDVVRGIYPMVATVTVDGFGLAGEPEVAERFGALIERKRQEGQQP